MYYVGTTTYPILNAKIVTLYGFFFFFFEFGNQISTSFCVLSACQVLCFLKNVCTSQVSVHVVHGLVMKSQCQWSLYQMVFPCKHDESEIMGSICIGLCLCIYLSKKKIIGIFVQAKKVLVIRQL